MNGDGTELRQTGATLTVLIVDDIEFTAAALEIACSGLPGTEIKTASSAPEAIRILEMEPVAAVITDLGLPAMDGFELIQFIRGHKTHQTTPIIVVTADTNPDTPARATRLGANAFFSKPFSPMAVRRTLEQFLYAKQDSI